MPKHYDVSKKDIDRIGLLWRLGASRNKIAVIIKHSNNYTQTGIAQSKVDDHLAHNQAVKENRFNDRQRALLSGRPIVNYRKQREIQWLKDYIEEDNARFLQRLDKISPRLR